MVTRIRELLELRQLTPTQFADLIGVGRPVISHILSERNKPSLEVVQRVISAFPDIALPWLLSGTGPMLASATFEAPTASVAPALPPMVEVLATPDVAVALPIVPAAPPIAPRAAPLANATTNAARPLPPRFQPTRSTAAPTPLTAPTLPVTPPDSSNLPTPPTPVTAPLPAPSALVEAVPALTIAAATAETMPPATIPAPITLAANPPLPASMGSYAPISSLPPAYQQVPVSSSAAPAPAAASYAPEDPAMPITPTAPQVAPTAVAETAVLNPAAALSFLGEPGKAIRRIVIFYRDGSFSDYVPEGQ